MKIIHITDTHYGKQNEAIYKKEPSYAMQEAIKSINKFHKDAEFCIITGDLVHFGRNEAYEYLEKDLQKLEIPYHLIIGNHDDRENALKYFTSLKKDKFGFIQQSFECKNGDVFLMLDSVKVGTHAGFYCKQRQAWLKEQLEIYKDKKVYICVHHAPFNTGIIGMDKIRLDKNDSLKLYEALNSHGNIGHIFLGHYHRPMSGSWGKITFSTLRGMNHQVKLEFDNEKVMGNYEEPQYSVILIDEKNENEPELLVTHFHDFMHAQVSEFEL